MNKVEWGWRGQTAGNPAEPDPGRGNFLSPRSCGQSSERLIYWYLSRSTFCLPAHRHLGTRSPSGNARGGCRGCTSKLCVTTEIQTWYNARDNVFSFCFKFSLRPKSEISPKDWSRGKWNPCSQNICFHFPSPHLLIRITTLVLCPFVALAKAESVVRILKLRKTSSVHINFNHLDLSRNSFELCPTYTADRNKSKRKSRGRHRVTVPRLGDIRAVGDANDLLLGSEVLIQYWRDFLPNSFPSE
jgi:hypothetical protein